jgi:hypothetical protein
MTPRKRLENIPILAGWIPNSWRFDLITECNNGTSLVKVEAVCIAQQKPVWSWHCRNFGISMLNENEGDKDAV